MKKKLFLLLATMLVLMAFPSTARSDAAPYPNYIVNTSGHLSLSQPAYVPDSVLTNTKFGKVADMKLIGDKIAVVDSQNKTVDLLNQAGEILQTITSPDLKQPTGVAVDSAGNFYVADPVAKLVVKFNAAGQEIAKFAKPTDPLFGSGSPYAPTKIAVDSRGEMYLVGTGTTEGLIVLSNTGEFLGYFGGNQAQQTLIQQFQAIFGKGFGLKGALNNVAPAPSNVYIDQAGIVYTTTNVANGNSLRKLNLAGQNMLGGSADVGGALAVTTDNDGNIFVLVQGGMIGEYDANGDLLFVFGTNGNNGDQIGVFKNATAISVDAQDHVYVADSETGIIHLFQPTAFANEIHTGVKLINNGEYQKAKTYFSSISTQNNNFVLAYNSIGNADLLQGNYKAAEQNFYTAQNKNGYSQAFWYIRQNWLDNNLGYAILFVIALYVLWRLIKLLHRRAKLFVKFDSLKDSVKSNRIYDELRDLPRMIRHPIDTYYSFNYEGRGTLRASNIWLSVLLVEVGIYLVFTGYIFNSDIVQQVSIFMLLAGVLLAFLVFVIVNYLVASITDGEGSFRTVYIGTVHGLAPIILGLIPIVILTNILTFNEAFVISYALLLVVGWSIFLVAMMINKIHDFTFAGTLKNILLTLFAIVVMLFTVYVIYVLAGQLVNFVSQIIWEVTHG